MPKSALLQSTDIAILIDQIKQLPRNVNDIVLVLIAEHTAIDIHALWDALRRHEIPCAGGVFPGVIFGNRRYDSGIVVDVLPMAAAPSVITGLDTPGFQVNVQKLAGAQAQTHTALVLVDGLTKHIALFLERLFRFSGNTVQYIGGGAGSLSFQRKPCLFDQYGVYQDAAMVLWLNTSTTLGVRHGWNDLRGPFVATHSDGTKIYKLGNQTAFQVYSDIVKMQTGKTLTKENFFDIAKEHPLGIFHPKADRIVRDPIAFTDDGALVCVGEVPMRSLVYVLRGNKHDLVENAALAAYEAIRSLDQSHHYLIVDCISRVLYLENEFEKELDAVMRALPASVPVPYGVLSLGEIATFTTGKVEFFNKTIVIGALRNSRSEKPRAAVS